MCLPKVAAEGGEPVELFRMHVVGALDPEPYLRLWNVLAQIVERWKAGDGDLNDLITEAERSLLRATEVDEFPDPASIRFRLRRRAPATDRSG